MKKYPAPSKDTEFRKYWKKMLPKVVERDNFHESHLEQLSILCDLYTEYHNLSVFIKENGYTYESDGRYGETYKEFPQVKIQQKCISEIRQYSKILGLLLTKDNTGPEDPEKGKWE